METNGLQAQDRIDHSPWRWRSKSKQLLHSFDEELPNGRSAGSADPSVATSIVRSIALPIRLLEDRRTMTQDDDNNLFIFRFVLRLQIQIEPSSSPREFCTESDRCRTTSENRETKMLARSHSHRSRTH